jgi:hypothetical protein
MGHPRAGRTPPALWLTLGIFIATVAQLLVATFASGLPQFEGKGFGARLLAYPALMLLLPALWVSVGRRRARRRPPDPAPPLPWTGFALVMAPFLVDVTGNSLNLYDTLAWWDDANHLVNWGLLCAGIGVLLARSVPWDGWWLGVLVTGIGSLLALGWELAEWYAFIRHGTELATAYQDTLGDQALGTVGAALAGVLVARSAQRAVR